MPFRLGIAELFIIYSIVGCCAAVMVAVIAAIVVLVNRPKSKLGE